MFSSTWDIGTPNELWNHALKCPNPKPLAKGKNNKGYKTTIPWVISKFDTMVSKCYFLK